LLKDPFWLPHILAHVNIDRPDEGYPKLKIFNSKLILDGQQCRPIAQIATHCMFSTLIKMTPPSWVQEDFKILYSNGHTK